MGFAGAQPILHHLKGKPLKADLKEIIGTLMRALDGAAISRAQVEDLAFEANGELQIALNDAYLILLEFAYDCDAGVPADRVMRGRLRAALDEIVRCADLPL